jgi:hypothetical protein
MAADLFRQALGAIISRQRASTTNPSSAVWGEELLHQSLTTLWYPRDWSDVDDDELVLFLPSLFSSDGIGVKLPIRRAFIKRLGASIRVLESNGHRQTLRRIAEVGAISSILTETESWHVAEDSLWDEEQSLVARCSTDDDVAAWRFELAVLACIDRMLADATPSVRTASCLIEAPSLADVLVGSIHTSINGAYAYPKYAFAHEILGTGAWIGLLMRGRSALMPDFAAEVILAYLDPTKRSRTTECDPIANLLEWHAGFVGGASLLIRYARKVKRSGCPQLVKPAGSARGTKRKCSWYPELECTISHRMTFLVN